MSTVPPLVPPTPTPPPSPEPAKPVSGLKIALWTSIAVLVATGVTLLIWEQGRVDLFAWLDVRGARRQQADLIVRNREPSSATQLFELYRYDAERKDPMALWELGNRYQAGNGVGQNDRRARESWEAAAATGDPICQMRLSEKFERGDKRTLSVDLPRSIELLRMAASQGESTAQDKLADFLLRISKGSDSEVISFVDILSEEQQNQIRSLESLSAAMSPPAGTTVTEKANKKRVAVAEIAKLVRAKLQSESYLWLSILAINSGEEDVRQRRDKLNNQIAQGELTLTQEAVDRWNTTPSPGTKASPFAKIDGQSIQLPEDGKVQTLGEMLKAVANEGNSESTVPEVVKANPSLLNGSSTALSGINVPDQQNSTGFSFESTVSFITQVRLIQSDAAVQRNVFFVQTLYTANGKLEGATNWSLYANGLARAANRMHFAAKAIADYEKNASKNVHTSAREYARRLAKSLDSRADCFRVCAQCAYDIFNGKLSEASFITTLKLEMEKQDAFMKPVEELILNMETSLREAFGKNSGAPLSEEIYKKQIIQNNERLRKAVEALNPTSAYALVTGIKYNGWTFEFGEMRETRIGNAQVSGGCAILPVQFSVVGRDSGNSKIFNLSLMLALDGDRVVLLNLY